MRLHSQSGAKEEMGGRNVGQRSERSPAGLAATFGIDSKCVGRQCGLRAGLGHNLPRVLQVMLSYDPGGQGRSRNR